MMKTDDTSDFHCPDELWKRVARRVNDGPPPRRRFPPKIWLTALLALVAATAFLVYARHRTAVTRDSRTDVVATVAAGPDRFLAVAAGVDTLIHRAEIGGDESRITAYMRSHGFPFRLQPVSALAETDARGHPARFIGARERMVEGGHVLDLMWECCGQAVVVEVAAEGTRPARAIHKAAEAGNIQDVRQFRRHVAALVSHHKAKPFLALVQPDSPDYS